MGWLSVATALCASVGIAPTIALAEDALDKAAQNPNQWVLPLGSYSGIRHSKLTQINTKNADKLHVAWTMSTGTLRGQEGQPLVIGNMMYFESSYPNFVYAINLDKVGEIVWKFANPEVHRQRAEERSDHSQRPGAQEQDPHQRPELPCPAHVIEQAEHRQ